MNAERLLQLVGSFNREWRNEMEEYIKDERKEALDSIIANRNKIVHGEPVGLTISRIREYYVRVCEIVDYVAMLFR